MENVGQTFDAEGYLQQLLKKERMGLKISRVLAISFILGAFGMIVWNFYLIQSMSLLNSFAANTVFFFIWSKMVFILGCFLIAGFLMHYSLKSHTRYEKLLAMISGNSTDDRAHYIAAIQHEKQMIMIFKIICFTTLVAAITMMGYTVLIGSGLMYIETFWGDLSWSFVILTAWSRALFIVVNLIIGIVSLYQLGNHRGILITYLEKLK